MNVDAAITAVPPAGEGVAIWLDPAMHAEAVATAFIARIPSMAVFTVLALLLVLMASIAGGVTMELAQYVMGDHSVGAMMALVAAAVVLAVALSAALCFATMPVATTHAIMTVWIAPLLEWVRRANCARLILRDCNF